MNLSSINLNSHSTAEGGVPRNSYFWSMKYEVTQLTGIRSRVSLKWPQGNAFNKLREFSSSFPVPVPIPNIILHPPEIIQVVRAAFDSFKEFTENGDQLGDSHRSYSFFKIQNYDLQLSYIIKDAVKIFTTEAHDKFLVKESDFH